MEEKSRKKCTILGISIWRLLAYFIIYSFLGYIIETLFGIVTKGVWESRQSFLYGPFCAIYGVGAVIMIIFLQYFSKSHNTLFIGGFIIGSITEYLVSLIGELILNIKWWDYSDMPLNINGRVCVYFSIFWGFLAMYLMGWLNPKIDKFIGFVKSKINLKTLKTLTLTTTIVLFIDCVITGFALSAFLIRVIQKNNIDVEYKQKVSQEYNVIYNNEKLSTFIYKVWGDEKMIRTFPNIKVEDKNGEIIYIDSLLKDIKPYYFKVFNKK